MSEVATISYQNFDRYCQRHHYLFRAFHYASPPPRHPVWGKIHAVESSISDGAADWVCWIDCDALFMNHNVGLEKFLDSRFDVLFCKDFNGLSTSFMLAKASAWALAFFRVLNLCGDCSNKNPDGHGDKREQNTIKLLLHNFPDLQQHCSLIEDQTTNRHYIQNDFRSGDFILHFPCMSNSERLIAMRKMQVHVIPAEKISCNHPPDTMIHANKSKYSPSSY